MPMRILQILLMIALAGCASNKEFAESIETAVLREVGFEALPGWGTDDFATFKPAFEKTCDRILKANPTHKMGPLAESGTFAEWQPLCRDYKKTPQSQIKSFFESRTTPYLVTSNGKEIGLFTGYYEASLEGSRTRSGTYQTPLHNRADDLVMVQLGDFRADLKRHRIAGRVVEGRLRPYETRRQIVNGTDYPHKDDVLVWVDDPVDAFFVQIQGSGIVTLSEGETMRIGYAGQNGHPYYAIGHELVKRGAVAQEDLSMQVIRAWMAANPAEAPDVMNTNDSYVFFRELETDGPVGGEGVTLTAGRSLAIDSALLSYGLPLWTDIGAPLKDAPPIRRLMIAQDTGGAIHGAVRGDVFWGHGEEAESLAGPMKSTGRYWVLLPKQ